MLKPLPPIGLLSPIVHTVECVKIFETGTYDDKFGTVHRHQLFQWAAALNSTKRYAPVFLEHHPLTGSFFGYLYALTVVGDSLCADIAFTKYGLEVCKEYSERHMGAGWSVGLSKGHLHIVELTLCRRPRISSTHTVDLDKSFLKNIDFKRFGVREPGALSNDLTDQIVDLVKDIVNYEYVGAQTQMLQAIVSLQTIIESNGIEVEDVQMGDK